MNKDVINHAVDKKFSDFSELVKSELTNKLNDNEIYKNYKYNIDKINHFKSSFTELANYQQA